MTDSRDSANPYGVLTFISWKHDWNNYFYDSDDKLEHAARLMADAGIGFARADFLWADLEPRREEFDFAHQDHVLSILAKYGIKILGTLNYNPSWRAVPWNAAPDPSAFLLYARAVVRHFKDRVKYWEIWNEPDYEFYWTPQDDLSAYCSLLKSVYPAIKQEDPTAQVLTGGLIDGAKHLIQIYEKAGRDAFDIVNLHPFVNPLVPQALEKVQQAHRRVLDVMQAFNDGEKAIWITELGCPGAEPGQAAGGWWAGEVPNEAQQAQWLETVYTNVLNWKGVQKIFWAFLRDTDQHFKNDIDRFGLLRLDFSPKPAYLAYKKLATKRKKASR